MPNQATALPYKQPLSLQQLVLGRQEPEAVTDVVQRALRYSNGPNRSGQVNLQRQTQITNLFEKWKISFSAKTGEDPDKFIQDLEETAQILDLTDEEIIRNLPAILSGEALEWFRLNKNSLQTYKNFVPALLKQYEAFDLEGTLLQEAENRTQAKEKTMGTYLTKIRIIFDQFPESLPLKRQLDIVYKNLHPDYLRNIFRTQFKSYDELQ